MADESGINCVVERLEVFGKVVERKGLATRKGKWHNVRIGSEQCIRWRDKSKFKIPVFSEVQIRKVGLKLTNSSKLRNKGEVLMIDKKMIAFCGTYCGVCEWKDKIGCKGCKANRGIMFWGECVVEQDFAI